MTEKELLKLKEKVEDAEQAIQQFKGRKKELLEQLKTDFKCNSIKEAKIKIKELESELDTLKVKLKDNIKQIKKKYNGGKAE